MVKCTIDLIQGAAQYVNALRERELNLRGHKIPMLENLGATLDQFDSIDFSDNELRKVDNFPYLPRLKCLLFNNNRIMRIGERLNESLPKLDSVIFTNNNIQELGDIENLSVCKTITMLSFLHNPVAAKENYRLYVIFKFPNLRVLDFRKVRQKEKDEAKKIFKSKVGKDQLKEIEKRAKTFVPGAPLAGVQDEPGLVRNGSANGSGGLTVEQIRSIKTAIAKASTLEEVEKLNQMLKTGQIPGEYNGSGLQPPGDVVEMDE